MPADPKTVVFHIGVHKTGTTLIQDYLGQQLAGLREHRIDHIPRGEMSRLVSWGDRLITEPEPFRERLAAFRGNPEVDLLVLSHEDTVGHPFHRAGDGSIYPDAARNLGALREALKPFDVRIVISLRRQHEFIGSYYVQSIHEGGVRSWAEWAQRVDRDKVSWLPLVDAARRHFGAGNVALIDFAAIRRGEGEYVRQFCALVDPTYVVDPHFRPSRSNRSVSQKGLQLALSANPHLRTVTERRELTDFLQRYFSNADYPRAEPIEAEDEQRLRDLYATECDTLFGQVPAEPTSAS